MITHCNLTTVMLKILRFIDMFSQSLLSHQGKVWECLIITSLLTLYGAKVLLSDYNLWNTVSHAPWKNLDIQQEYVT